MNKAISKGDGVTWSTSGEHADKTRRAKSIYGDGPFIISELLPGDFDPNYNGMYAVLTDKSGQVIMRDKIGRALFEIYLFQQA